MNGFLGFLYVVILVGAIVYHFRKKKKDKIRNFEIFNRLNDTKSSVNKSISAIPREKELVAKLEGEKQPIEKKYEEELYTSYVIDSLIDRGRVEVEGNYKVKEDNSIVDITNERSDIDYNYDYTYSNQYWEWGLGGKFKDELGLTDEQVRKLNALIDTSNKFNTIEYCAINLVKMFLKALSDLENEFKKNGTSIETETLVVADIEITKRFRYRKNSNNYKNQLDFYRSTINQLIYKIGENALRDRLYAGRKTDLKYYIFTDEGYSEFNNRFLPHIENSIKDYFESIESPSLEDEQELNVYSRARWKHELKQMQDDLLPNQPQKLYEGVVRLGIQNEKNPAVENIFFNASKEVSKYSNTLSLKLFVYYVHYDLISEYFDNKQLTKTVQKSLFKKDEHKTAFEEIINGFISERDLDKALNSIDDIFKPKRKTIKLNKNRIEEVEGRHSGTVEILNEILQDEELQAVENSESEVVLNISMPEESEVAHSVKYIDDISFTKVQVDFLDLATISGFVMSANEVEDFAKCNGSFGSTLIESVNDACYETLDDLLIEEDDETIYINQDYYKTILA